LKGRTGILTSNKPILLISESLKGEHHRVSSPFVLQLSTQGSRAVRYTPDGYSVSSSFKRIADSLNPQAVLIGTDLDAQGTKIGTVIADYFRERGIPVYRYALTSKGYAKTGRFYTEREMKALHSIDSMNIAVARAFEKRYSLPFKASVKKAGMVALAQALPSKIGVRPKGTSTITAYTQGLLRRVHPSAVRSRLERAYAGGLIDYPRVDADYEPNPYQVYAHPPLTSRGYKDEFVRDFEVEELPLRRETSLLFFRKFGFTTPAVAERDYGFIEEFFTEDMRVKEEYKSLVREFLAVSEETAELYVKLIETAHPNAPLYDAPPPPKTKKEVDRFLEDMERIRKSIEREGEGLSKERNKEKGQESSPLPEL